MSADKHIKNNKNTESTHLHHVANNIWPESAKTVMEEIGRRDGPEEFVGQTRRSREQSVSNSADACIRHMEQWQLASDSDRGRQSETP